MKFEFPRQRQRDLTDFPLDGSDCIQRTILVSRKKLVATLLVYISGFIIEIQRNLKQLHGVDRLFVYYSVTFIQSEFFRLGSEDIRLFFLVMQREGGS